MKCKECEAQIKTWQGSDPKCAFKNGTFSEDNWMCGTMTFFRNYNEDSIIYSEDQKGLMLDVGGGKFLVLGWYKNRGRVEFASIICEFNSHNLDLGYAELFIKYLKEKK